jgi:hypothetical protein
MDRIRFSSGGLHRDCEKRGSSNDFFSKFSALVHRASHWQKENPPDHDRSDSNQHFHDQEQLQRTSAITMNMKESKPTRPGGTRPLIFRHSSSTNSKMLRHTGQSMTAPMPFGSMKAGTAIIRRLPMVLTKDELERRRQLETCSFQVLHEAFIPSNMVQKETTDNNSTQQKEDDTQIYLDSEEKWPILQRKQSNDEDHEELEPQQEVVQEDEDDQVLSQPTAYHEELLFDEANITDSVRKLVQRIETESLSEERSLSVSMNQNDNVEDMTEDMDPHDVSGLMEQIRHQKQSYPLLLHKVSNTTTISAEDEECAVDETEIQVDGSKGQDEDICFTSSMRRLILRPKDDSDRIHYFEDHPPRYRRRGTSCPPPRINSTSLTVSQTPLSSHKTRLSSTSSSCQSRCLTLHPHKKTIWEKLFRFKKKQKKMFTNKEEEEEEEELLENIEGTRWKIIELAFRFGERHCFYLEQAINMFFPLRKYGRRGDPHATRLHCSSSSTSTCSTSTCSSTIQWQQKKGNLSEPMDLAQVLHIVEGRQTFVFLKFQTDPKAEATSLSIVFPTRTLDLETQNENHRNWLLSALRTLVSFARKQQLQLSTSSFSSSSSSSLHQVVIDPKSPLIKHNHPSDTREHVPPVTTA